MAFQAGIVHVQHHEAVGAEQVVEHSLSGFGDGGRLGVGAFHTGKKLLRGIALAEYGAQFGQHGGEAGGAHAAHRAGFGRGPLEFFPVQMDGVQFVEVVVFAAQHEHGHDTVAAPRLRLGCFG